MHLHDSRASENEDENRCIADSDDVKTTPLGCLVAKPISHNRLVDEQCTFSLGMCVHIDGASLTNPIIFIDHDVEPSRQERMQCSLE